MTDIKNKILPEETLEKISGGAALADLPSGSAEDGLTLPGQASGRAITPLSLSSDTDGEISSGTRFG